MRYPFVIISAGLTRIAEARDAGQLTNHVDKVLSLTGVCPAHEMCAAALRRRARSSWSWMREWLKRLRRHNSGNLL